MRIKSHGSATELLHREEWCPHKWETAAQTRQLKDSECIDNFGQTQKVFILTEKLLVLEFMVLERAYFGFASAILEEFYQKIGTRNGIDVSKLKSFIWKWNGVP